MDEEQMRRFESSYDAYGAMVYRLAMVYLGRRADAEDVTQEVFCRLLWRAPAFLDEAHEKRWLLQVTTNLCKDQLKGFWRKRAAALDVDIPTEHQADQGVLEAILALPETYKGPIHLHYYEGYSAREIGSLLGEKPATVFTRLERGRQKLRTYLEQEDLI